MTGVFDICFRVLELEEGVYLNFCIFSVDVKFFSILGVYDAFKGIRLK